MPPLVHPDRVRAAAARIAGVAHRTPLRHSAKLSRIAGVEVHLKLENEQLTGSFKLRGAFNTLASLSEAERARGIVASSAGNHGLGVAWAARHFGITATIFVPASAPAVKRDGIVALGARVDDSRPDYDAAHDAALELAAREGARFVNPCAGAELIAGQGTVALEILEDLPSVGAVIVPVGGGGLLGGIGSVLRAEAPEVRILGAQSERTDAMARSLAAGHIVDIGHDPTLADGLAGGIDEEGLAIGRAALDEIVRVPEEEIARAIAWLAEEESSTVEGSGAVGVAALRAGLFAGLRSPVVVVLSGGNIDPAVLREVRGLRVRR
ncbi:MAG: threonine/serine dehydratase [Gemmatimonadaceae bacterium]|nr:threonine/serine dehydratase [Gemmatimonadaceae bacterium]NUR17938.1 threonine/serine dehydratase [Gemmatimonadaceae bacterium]NUS98700.1 threonine/serine dehydratase [Gemmatimonadaceae bacterium]